MKNNFSRVLSRCRQCEYRPSILIGGLYGGEMGSTGLGKNKSASESWPELSIKSGQKRNNNKLLNEANSIVDRAFERVPVLRAA